MKYSVLLLLLFSSAMSYAEIRVPPQEKPADTTAQDKQSSAEKSADGPAATTPAPAAPTVPAGPPPAMYTVDLEKKTLVRIPDQETNLPPEISRPETYELPAMMPGTTWNRNLMPPLIRPEDIPVWHDQIRAGDVPAIMKYTGDKP